MGTCLAYASNIVLESTDNISASHYKDPDSFQKEFPLRSSLFTEAFQKSDKWLVNSLSQLINAFVPNATYGLKLLVNLLMMQKNQCSNFMNGRLNGGGFTHRSLMSANQNKQNSNTFCAMKVINTC